MYYLGKRDKTVTVGKETRVQARDCDYFQEAGAGEGWGTTMGHEGRCISCYNALKKNPLK